jgi:bifunctional UDP-N-acetylglucosamine pyrophosphorylase/glucosamine-1-phosphate N-acetyltransferase
MKVTPVVLAAGLGTRMCSAVPKVLHCLAGQPIIDHVLTTLSQIKGSKIRLVAGKELIAAGELKKLKDKYDFKVYEQKERLGTAHALSCALGDKLSAPLLVMCGDTPLIKEETLANLLQAYQDSKAAVAVLAFKCKNPSGYGRLVTFAADLLEIVEEKDASPDQRQIKICNAGIYIIDHQVVNELLTEIKNDNNNREYYLPDIVRLANKKGLKTTFAIAPESEVLGINNRVELAKAETIMQNRLRQKAQLSGVTLIDPKTVYFAADTVIGKDSVIYPNVYFGSQVTLGENCEVYSFSHLEGVEAGNSCRIGPFARIRPKTKMAEGVRVGNFVEIKSMNLQAKVKASHLSYLGDGEIGENSNVGAGTIFCNYDGYAKHRTQIGKDVFIGSNVALVAPLQVGNRAIIGAGSVITEDVEEDSLSLGRARQVNFKQKAELIRKKKSEEKT